MTIPASDIVSINPGVIGAGGNALALNGVIMTKSTLLPTGSVKSFSSDDAVKTFFGASSDEYPLSQIYFDGFDGSTTKPGTLIFAPYVDADRAAWVKSGSLASLSLTDIQAFSGTMIVTVDGTTFTSSSINLSAASSFSNAATLITAGFTGAGKPTCTWDATISAFFLTSPTTGAASTISAVTGTMAASLLFTAETGATLSQGDVADTEDTAMTNVKSNTMNWAPFITMWEPDAASKKNFAIWNNAQNLRFIYLAWDTDAQAIVDGSTTCFGYVANNLGYEGVMPLYNTVELAAFVMGMIASIDFTRANARITAAFKAQSGLAATCTDKTESVNLLANGYSYYGEYATANDQFVFLYNGQVSGEWLWLDAYVNQIYLNNQLQLAIMDLFTSVTSISYNESGYSLVRSAMNDPIQEFINFGGIRKGITLSESQKAQVNLAAGRDVAGIIEQQGYYLQILDPGAQVRAARGTPVINLWYTDGGAIQKITVASIDII